MEMFYFVGLLLKYKDINSSAVIKKHCWFLLWCFFTNNKNFMFECEQTKWSEGVLMRDLVNINNHFVKRGSASCGKMFFSLDSNHKTKTCSSELNWRTEAPPGGRQSQCTSLILQVHSHLWCVIDLQWSVFESYIDFLQFNVQHKPALLSSIWCSVHTEAAAAFF